MQLEQVELLKLVAKVYLLFVIGSSTVGGPTLIEYTLVHNLGLSKSSCYLLQV